MKWPPKKSALPPALQGFTPHRDGFVRWYRGGTRTLAIKSLNPLDVEKEWEICKRRWDAKLAGNPAPRTAVTLRSLAAAFLERQDRRVLTGRPTPLSRHTYEDYCEVIERFRDIVGADAILADLVPGDFNRFAGLYDKRSPSSLARAIAYLKAFFTWGADAKVISEPDYGPDFVKPSRQVLRDSRLSHVRAFTPAEIQSLWGAARREVKLWIALGLNGAMDNSDIATLSREVIADGVIDFRRRKTGKIRRVIPLHPRTLRLLNAYLRTIPREQSTLFLTPKGLPLVRIQPHRVQSYRNISIDHISLVFRRLLPKAGLRGKTKLVWVKSKGRCRELYGKGDGRGFRSLRTSFANLAPHGFKEEVEIILGHAHGSVLLDNYLEDVGLERLRELVSKVWQKAFTPTPPPGDATHEPKGDEVKLRGERSVSRGR